jgi:hypothetical protein
MNRTHLSRISLISAARIALAGILLAAFFAGVVPLVPVSAGSMCHLECCAGRAPHASGSCMSGSCEANLSAAPAHSHHAEVNPVDELCGLPGKIGTKTLPGKRTKSAAPQSSDQLVSAAFEKPCQSDCGSCASSSTNSNRQRNSAAIANANRPRPPTTLNLSSSRYHPVQTLGAQRRQGAPRGPPSFIS